MRGLNTRGPAEPLVSRDPALRVIAANPQMRSNMLALVASIPSVHSLFGGTGSRDGHCLGVVRRRGASMQTRHQAFQAFDGLFERFIGGSVGETDEPVGAAIAEVPARRQRDVGFLQRSFAELPGGEAGAAYVEVDVKGAIWRDRHRKPDPRETV